MNPILKKLTLILGLLIVLSSCNPENKKVKNLAPNAHQIVAEEVIQATSYTYVRVTEEENEYWIAIEKQEVKNGETYFWSSGDEMQNFVSKELSRSFPRIMFISDFTDKPITTDNPVAAGKRQLHSMAGKQTPPEMETIDLEPVQGGISIAQLFSNSTVYSGKNVTVRGMVVKFSPDIMKRNWVHIQDGTKSAAGYDLAVTTHETVRVGDTVVFSGIIALNKDFGAGYTYSVIMEDARKR